MYLINGEIVKKKDFHIPIEDMLVWRGDGIFEAIQLHEGFPFGIDLHLDRLSSSAEKLNLDSTYIQASIRAYNRSPDSYVVTRALASFQRTMISGDSDYDHNQLNQNE